MAAERVRRPPRTERRHGRPREARRTAIGVFVVVLAATLIAPATATAIDIPNPIDILGGAAGDAATHVVGDVLDTLFGKITIVFTRDIVTGLVVLPDFAQGNVARLEELCAAMAWGMLGAIATIATIRYAIVGITGSGRGGFEAVQGVVRAGAAGALIVLWPWAFHQSMALVNLMSHAVLNGRLAGAKSAAEQVAEMMSKALTVGTLHGQGLGLIIGLIIAMASALLVLGLLIMKVVLAAAATVIYALMPLAIVLWPVEELAWLARSAVRALAIIVLIPVVWAACFAVFGALGGDALDALVPQGGKSVLSDVVLKPLAALGLLYVMFVLPKHLLRHIPLAGQLHHAVGAPARIAAYVAGGQVSRAIQPFIPRAAGGQRAGSQAAGAAGGKAAAAKTAAAAAGPAGIAAAAAIGAAQRNGRPRPPADGERPEDDADQQASGTPNAAAGSPPLPPPPAMPAPRSRPRARHAAQRARRATRRRSRDPTGAGGSRRCWPRSKALDNREVRRHPAAPTWPTPGDACHPANAPASPKACPPAARPRAPTTRSARWPARACQTACQTPRPRRSRPSPAPAPPCGPTESSTGSC